MAVGHNFIYTHPVNIHALSKDERQHSDSDRVSTIEYSLLGLLKDRPMHGYELYQELCRKSGLGLIWTVRQSQLYAILARLESRSLVASQIVDSGPRPARKVFHLTEEGTETLESWLPQPAGRKDFRLDFCAKLLFARAAGCASALVAAQKGECALWLAEMRSRGAACPELSMDRLVYRYRVSQLESTAAWLDECASFVEAEKSTERGME
jgi:DNA-binding PadR family transcriptional regulator